MYVLFVDHGKIRRAPRQPGTGRAKRGAGAGAPALREELKFLAASMHLAREAARDAKDATYVGSANNAIACATAILNRLAQHKDKQMQQHALRPLRAFIVDAEALGDPSFNAVVQRARAQIGQRAAPRLAPKPVLAPKPALAPAPVPAPVAPVAHGLAAPTLPGFSQIPSPPSGWKKSKLDAATLNALDLGSITTPSGYPVKIRVSEITLDTGERIWMTNLMHKGSYGTVHYGIRENGEFIAVKKFRFLEKFDANGHRIPSKTQCTKWCEYAKERDITRLFGPLQSGEVRTKGYFVQDLGRELDDGLKRIPLAKRRDILRSAIMQWALGLQRIHDDARVHCDVKLENALVYPGGLVKVADMGLARALQPDGMVPPELVGTPTHMAPEVLMRLPFNTRVDTWSLAIAWTRGTLQWELDTPFSGMPDLEDATKRYSAWRLGVWFMDAHGQSRIDRSRILSPNDPASTPWDRYFYSLYQVNPAAADALLTRPLYPADVANIAQEQKYADFAQWQANLLRPDADGNFVVDLDLIKPPGAPGATEWDVFFYDLKVVDAPMCALLLNRMLRVNALDRADMMEVAEKVAEIMTEHNAMTLTEMSDEWDAIDAKDINRQTALSALALVRQYVMDGILFFPPGQG